MEESKSRVVKHLIMALAALVVMAFGANRASATAASVCATTQSVTLSTTAFTCSLAEVTTGPTKGLPEEAAFTLTGAVFASSQVGIIEFVDSDNNEGVKPSKGTAISDVLAFTNVNGVATVTFWSDGDKHAQVGVPSQFAGLTVISTVAEDNDVTNTFNVTLAGGGTLTLGVCSDDSEGPCPNGTSAGASDVISLSGSVGSTTPEPGTLLLLGSGLSMLGLGLRWRR